MAKTKVLVIDDSALMRKALTEILNADPDLEVVDTASDPLIAREKIKKLSPDVLTLDVEMPKMDGLTFLKNLMRLRPMPVVMISTLTEQGAAVTLEALEIGAVDFVPKPKVSRRDGMEEIREVIVGKVKAAATARVRPLPSEKPAPTKVDGLKRSPIVASATGPRILAIGASTGAPKRSKMCWFRLRLGFRSLSPSIYRRCSALLLPIDSTGFAM